MVRDGAKDNKKNIWESIYDRIGSCIEVDGKLANY